MAGTNTILMAVLAGLVSLSHSAVVSHVYLSNSITHLSPAVNSQMMTLQIDLALKTTNNLMDELRDLSTPGSPNYGKWLTKDEVDALFPPVDRASGIVTSWLRSHGVERIVERGSNIRFAAPVGTMNHLLNTTFAYYDVGGSRKLRTTEYSVPETIAPYVQLIHPTTFFGNTKSHRMPITIKTDAITKEAEMSKLANELDDCKRLITPACLRSAYNIGNYVPSANSGSRIGFGSFLNESARLEDLHTYQRMFGIPEQNFTSIMINGAVDNQEREGSHVEANLDAQFQSAMSYPLPQVQFLTGGAPPFVPSVSIPDAEHNTNEPYLEYYSFLLDKSNEELPQVISNSYGDDEQSYAKRVCDMAGMLGLRGVTVLESSGDTGVGAPCISNDGQKRLEFTPGFPASCPYITAVGGTESWAPEAAWVASSGGFSNYFELPWYQQDAVSEYLGKHIEPKTKAYYEQYTNFSGRAFPDLSAHSLSPNYLFFNSNETGQTGGTSAAAPVVGGIIALLNDARFKAGKPSMGFINPFLYSLEPNYLTDIVKGKAVGCNGYNMQTGMLIRDGGRIPWASWNATKGWDPVTGLGVPNFQKMLLAALS
ncbi:peptidase S8/S53 domain-containing protein [Astrocystis sublimbata]|nr:peptidase S8/S53 domain-containing protein [Astrocystis sublimbata]